MTDPNQASQTAIHARVARLRASADPTQIARLRSGWAVLGELQFLRGYCLLLPDPVVPHLQAMARSDRANYLDDLGRLGDAVFAVTRPLRINYAIFGNVEPALHAHVIPRYVDEDATLRTAHPWMYDWNSGPSFDAARDLSLIEEIRRALEAGT